MIIGFIIWSIAALLFLCIGIGTWRAKEAVGFFTFAEAPKVRDIKKYNQSVTLLLIFAAAVLEILGILFLFSRQNSILFIPVILGVVFLVIGMITVYIKIESKYRA